MNANGLTDVHQMPATQVTTVTVTADTVAGLTGQRSAHLDLIDAQRFDLVNEMGATAASH